MKDSMDSSISWDGWYHGTFGLEVQTPWARFMLDGKKTIETRGYPLPDALFHQKIFILETQVGERGAGISTIDDTVNLNGSIQNMVQCIGWCIFDSCFPYRNKAQFESDYDMHLVPVDSVFAYSEQKEIFGWTISSYGYINKNDVHWDTAVRCKRSLFQLQRNNPFIP